MQPSPNPKRWPALATLPQLKEREREETAARRGRESIAGQTSGESEQAAYTRTFPSHSSPPKGTLTAACKLSTHLATPKHQELRGRGDYTKAKWKAACPSQPGASPLCCGTAPGPSVASRRWLGVRRRGQMATQALALSSCLIGTCCQTGPPSPCRRSHSKCRSWRRQRPLQCEAVVALPQPEASLPTLHPHQQVILSILSDSLATPSPRQGGLPLPTSTVKTGGSQSPESPSVQGLSSGPQI